MLRIFFAFCLWLFANVPSAVAQVTEIQGPCVEQCLPRVSAEVYVIAPRGPDDIHIDRDPAKRQYVPRLYTHTGEGNTIWVCDLPVSDIEKWNEAITKATTDRHGLTLGSPPLQGVVNATLPFTYEKIDGSYHAVIRPVWRKTESTMRAVGERRTRALRLPMQPRVLAGTPAEDPLRFECDCETWLKVTGWKAPESLPEKAKYAFYREEFPTEAASAAPDTGDFESQ